MAVIGVSITLGITAPAACAFAADTPLPSAGDAPHPATATATAAPDRTYTAVSNVMKTKHDTVKNSISNIR
jgi:hypothetical protein